MNKKLFLISALAAGICLSAGALAACGDNTGDVPGPDVPGQDDGVYTITFQTNGGSAVESVDVNAGQSVDLDSYITSNSDDNYYFYGWYLDEGCTNRAPAQFVPDCDVTLYAAWGHVETYTLTFDSCGGSAVPAQQYTSYEYLSAPAAPTRENYRFDGWYWDSNYTKEFIFEGNTMPTSDLTVTVYAKWVRLYTVTFNTDSNTVIAPVTGEEGTEISAPATPVKDGYVFDGWFADADFSTPFEFSVITGDATVYAKWHQAGQSISVTLNFNSPVSGATATAEQLILNEGAEIAASEVEEDFASAIQTQTDGKAVYIFGGWCLDEEGTMPCDTVPYSESGSVSLYAHWVRSAAYCIVTLTGGQSGTLVVYANKNSAISSEISSYYGSSVTQVTAQDGTLFNINDVVERDMTLSPAADLSDFTFTQNAGSYGYTLTSYSGNDASVEIPSSYNGAPVISIGDNAFKDNTVITVVTIPDNVTSIGADAFSGCTALTTVNGGNYVTRVGLYAFAGLDNVGVVEGGIKYLNSDRRVILNYENGSAITIPSTVIAIAEGAFWNASVTSVTFASGCPIKEIPAYAFRDCLALRTINLSSLSISSIGNYAFAGCSSLSAANLPSTVTSLGDYAFWNCNTLSSVTMSGVTELGEYVFRGCRFTSLDFTGLAFTQIPAGAFSECTSLESIILPQRIASIGNEAFKGCTALTTVTVNAPDDSRLSAIGDEAFSGCSALRTLIIFARTYEDGALTSLGSNALQGCAQDLVIFVADGSPAYDRTSQYYEGTSDRMLTYTEIYSQSVTYSD